VRDGKQFMITCVRFQTVGRSMVADPRRATGSRIAPSIEQVQDS
jgi:hypothetical protein